MIFLLSVMLFVLSLGSLAASFFTGRTALLTPALLEGAGTGVTLCLSLAGPICLWSGVSEVFLQAGLSRLIARAMRLPVMFFIRPRRPDPLLLASLSENISSNLLGIGNAATPAGLHAASLLEKEEDHPAAARLALLNSSSIQLIPLTAAAMRAAYGADSPMDILPGVLVSSLAALAASFTLFRLLTRHG